MDEEKEEQLNDDEKAVGVDGDEQVACEEESGDVASERDVSEEARQQADEFEELTSRQAVESMDICSSGPIPSGWIKVNDRWDPTRCGRPRRIVYNVTTIVRYDNLPKGAVLEVCARSRVPSGWVAIGTRWDPNRCGHPQRIVKNMKRIRRVR